MVRRELTTRNKSWAIRLAKKTAATGITPNSISILSMVFALFSGVMFYMSGTLETARVLFLLLGVFGLQMRLLCNMLDGMVAVEFNKKTNTGEVFNDAPDRVSDIFILLGASLAVIQFPWAIYLGFVVCILAILTAYVRLLGGSMNIVQTFKGPMAKQHRMAVLTVAVFVDIAISTFVPNLDGTVIYVSLWVIAIGAFVTCINRLAYIFKTMNS